jgi:site-specific DNA-methyltransferase (adenine-specific)
MKDGFTNVGNLNLRYAGNFEYMFVFSKGKVKSFNPLKDRLNSTFGNKICGSIRQVDGSMKSKSNLGKRTKRYGIRYNVWKYSVGFKKSGDDFSFEHPASFPENLAGDHIKSWSNEGGLVLDPFMGSGTTAKMAYLLNRKFLGFEISKKYCDLIQKRLNPHINNLFSNLGNVIKYEFESKD